MAKAIILGDPHLGKNLNYGKSGIGTALNSRIIDQLDILEWVLTVALDNNANDIIVTGDLFEDPKPPSTLVILLMSWLKKCSINNVRVHLIFGNHDFLRSGTYYMSALDIIAEADIEGIFTYKDIETIHFNDISFTLMPFRDRRSFNTNSNAEALDILKSKMPYEFASIPRDNLKVVVGHLAIEKSIFVGDEVSDLANELFCPVDMFKGYDAVFQGHVHKVQCLNKKDPFVLHIGSMDLSDFGESDHIKTIMLIDPTKEEKFESINIPTRPLNKISVLVPEGVVDTTNYVINSIKENYKSLHKSIVSIGIVFSSQEFVKVDRTLLEKSLLELGAFHIVKIVEERKIAEIKKKSATITDNSISEVSAVKLYADAHIDELMRTDFINLSNDIIKEFLQEAK